MLDKLDGKLKKVNGVYQPATAEEFSKAVDSIKEVVKAYGWGERCVHPYSWSIKIDDLIESWSDFKNFTPSSKHLMILELNGLVDIINAWLRYYEKAGWAVLHCGEIIFNGTEKQCVEYLSKMDDGYGELELVYIGC